ncbi:MAG: hydroxymethylglutaryl-CoA lyase, partial [Deltaproteobacteria bacterium]|nr:hydroxymethylglutaryl-CoA lyase [Deltaproteobacteria bacterium]
AGEFARKVIALKPTGTVASALVPNLRGAQLALESGVRNLVFVMSVSESHNINNVRRTPAESVSEAKKIWEMGKAYPEMTVKISLATVFGCPFEGKIKPEATLSFVREYYQLGFRDMSLADTVGYGNPREIQEVCGLCRKEFPDVTFGIHLHNTRGLGLANSFAAYEAGVRIIDGAIGGLGGCPFAPGASGNTSTEDLVFMFEERGVKTGIDLELLFEVGRYFQSMKKDVCFTSSILKVGVPAPSGAIRKDGSAQVWNS